MKQLDFMSQLDMPYWQQSSKAKRSRSPKHSDLWQTPLFIVKLVKDCFGGAIDLDPATTIANPTGAEQFFTPDDDGLQQVWRRRVFLNPPYSNPFPWVDKLAFSYKEKGVEEAIALLPSRCLHNKGTGGIIAQSASAFCSWRGRIAFIRDGRPHPGTDFDSALVYWGVRSQKFCEVFEGHGLVSLVYNSEEI